MMSHKDALKLVIPCMQVYMSGYHSFYSLPLLPLYYVYILVFFIYISCPLVILIYFLCLMSTIPGRVSHFTRIT